MPSSAACAAIRANHSARYANARLELWRQPNADPLDVQEHMMMVAIEHIEAGAEIRSASRRRRSIKRRCYSAIN